MAELPGQKPVAPLASSRNVGWSNINELPRQPLRQAPGPEKSDDKSDETDHLVSPQTGEKVHDSFEQLRETTAGNLDDKVEAMLRPMLRAWLDANLPTIVEGLVRKEIERVSRSK